MNLETKLGIEHQLVKEKTLDDYEQELNAELAKAKELVKKREEGEWIPDFDIRGRLYALAMELAPEARRQETEYMHALIDPQEGEVAVDIAAGEGFLTEPVAAWTHGPTYAVDPSQEQLHTLERKGNENIKPVHGTPDNPTILDQLPVGEVDIVTSFGGLHHVPDQRAMMENIAQMLKSGGRFAAGDVQSHSSLSHHFDTFVAAKCVTGHTARWLDKEKLEELSDGLPLHVDKADSVPIEWVFDSERQMALFFKGLHAYDLPDDEIIADLQEALGFEEQEDGKIHLHWPMLLFEIKKH